MTKRSWRVHVAWTMLRNAASVAWLATWAVGTEAPLQRARQISWERDCRVVLRQVHLVQGDAVRHNSMQ